MRNVFLPEQIFIADGYKSASILFSSSERPDAIVCINDEVAIGVIKYLKEHGVSVPDEVAVVGFDDNPMGLVCDPELTTLSPSIDLLSESLLNLLLREIESGENIKEDIRIASGIAGKRKLYNPKRLILILYFANMKNMSTFAMHTCAQLREKG